MKQDKLRIVHVTNTYTPFKGGIVQAIKAIVEQEQKDENDCLIVTLDCDDQKSEKNLKVQTIPTFFKCGYAENEIIIPWRVKHHLQNILVRWKPDIIHIHNPSLLGQAAVCLARKQHVPAVFSFHALYENYAHFIKMPSYVAKPLVRVLVRLFCNNVESILVPNSIIKKYVEDHNIKTPITILPNPIGNDILPLVEPAIKKYVTLPLKLLVVSRFVPEKNIESIIDCMRILAIDAELIIAGYGYWQASLEMYIKKSFGNTKPSITFCINPTRKKLAELYSWADFFLFASTSTAQGLVIAEAMAHATPVIALKGPGQEGIIIDYYNGFLTESVVHMATLLYRIALNPNLYITLQKGALESSLAYRSQTIVQKLNNHYHELIERYKPKQWYSMFLKSTV